MSKHLAYKNSEGVTYFLYSKLVFLLGGKPVRIYFFNKNENLKTTDPPANSPRPEEALPLGYGVRETNGRHIPIPYRKVEAQLIGGAKA